ncbi:MAG: hypothetical protein F6K25_27975 [Okeania sp. SIO2G4]|uniref:hormogonium polysaccharide secretion pseudopilin HpsC n=1 Tax=unclassified Okeania TaxID=2634635 RepID=UPI0013B8EE84|nr:MULTISPECIES: hormogonium polysaccharide secretion pseudopilin HpsC [unclassified Okeania]NEP06476.1 hypothetical protein [Okeania sp. SIO4D6]NEP40054.1 hypothetical protein [Okeania sp. SIO2H7]NEP75395.1 hypothetical protein [Okeania sp. SIO2G5]NEP96492.1 hypothetical protein [Okeania sp. SIO2F5]NEQ94280.1 hypothetical protein [Okeania sp. SIO2G4]
MKTLLKSLLKIQYQQRRSSIIKPTSGFTMIELLVGTIIAFLITVPLLSFVVDMLNTDVREQAKANSEQDIQAAVDYIAQDMSQALYVYDHDGAGGVVDAIEGQLPENDDENRKPILVFWKRQLVEEAIPVSACEEQCKDDDAYVLSLVAYYEITEDDDTSIWCQPNGETCPKRIARFQIQDGVTDFTGTYIDENGDTDEKLQRDRGFKIPTSDEGYEGWTKEDETYENNLEVLVNYVESFTLNEVTDNKLAKITIAGDSQRRIREAVDCAQSPSYCPKVTAQVGGRSRKLLE